MANRVPPQNLEAEKAVIGAILIDNKVLNEVIDIVRAEYFYDPRHELIFEHIEKLYNDNKAVDVLTLTESLKKSKKLRQSGGGAYLSELVTIVPTSANAKEYAGIVKENYIRREFISAGAQFDELARDETKDITEVINEIERNVLLLSRDSTTQDFYDTGELLERYMEMADEYAKNPNALRGISTGIRSLDDILGGLHKSDLVILAARPSVGKSSFAFHMARHAAINEKKKVAVFSLEMPAVQVITRMLAQEIQVDLWNLRMSKMSEADYKRFSSGSGKLAEASIFIDETPGVNIVHLRSKLRKLAIEQGLDMVVVDYLQLMQGLSGTDNRAQEIGEISRSLKILARELDIPIIALSQLNRAIENRAEQIPQLSDLRESGSIEQDADLVMFLSREIKVDEEENPREQDIYVHVAKHRNGPVGKVSMTFVPAQQLYLDN